MNEDDFAGDIGLIHMKSVDVPKIVTYGTTEVVIVDTGYYWLQFAPKGEHFWLSVVYDGKGEITQYYFDITYENHINENGDSFFYDLFLDVVLLPDGQIFLLDEDELEEALKGHIIDQPTYNMAIATAKEIMEKIEWNEFILRDFCNKYFNEMKSRL